MKRFNKLVLLVLLALIPLVSSCSPVKLAGKEAAHYFKDKQVLELVLAVENEDVDDITRLAKSGVNVNYVGEEKMTPLLWGTHGHKWKGVKALLENGADPNLITVNDRSTMVWSAGSKFPNNLKMMLEHGGDPNARDAKGDCCRRRSHHTFCRIKHRTIWQDLTSFPSLLS